MACFYSTSWHTSYGIHFSPGEVRSVHTHAVVLAHQIWWASTVPHGTLNMVFIAHLVYTVSRMADTVVLYTPIMVCVVHYGCRSANWLCFKHCSEYCA